MMDIRRTHSLYVPQTEKASKQKRKRERTTGRRAGATERTTDRQATERSHRQSPQKAPTEEFDKNKREKMGEGQTQAKHHDQN